MFLSIKKLKISILSWQLPFKFSYKPISWSLSRPPNGALTNLSKNFLLFYNLFNISNDFEETSSYWSEIVSKENKLLSIILALSALLIVASEDASSSPLEL